MKMGVSAKKRPEPLNIKGSSLLKLEATTRFELESYLIRHIPCNPWYSLICLKIKEYQGFSYVFALLQLYWNFGLFPGFSHRCNTKCNTKSGVFFLAISGFWPFPFIETLPVPRPPAHPSHTTHTPEDAPLVLPLNIHPVNFTTIQPFQATGVPHPDPE